MRHKLYTSKPREIFLCSSPDFSLFLNLYSIVLISYRKAIIDTKFIHFDINKLAKKELTLER